MPTSFASPVTTSSPVIEAVMTRKKKLSVASQKWKWAAANFIGAIFLLLEAHASSCHILVGSHSAWRSMISNVETMVILILVTNAVLDLYAHFFPLGISADSMPDLPFSPLQLKLLGVKENEFGFKTSSPVKQKDKKNAHPFGFSSPLNGSFLSPESSAVYSRNASSLQMSTLNSSSWIYQPANDMGSPTSHQDREKRRESKPSLSMNGTFIDEKSLREYLKEYEQKEKIETMSSMFDQQSGTGQKSNLWNSGMGGSDTRQAHRQDHSGILKSMAYQLSTPMPSTNIDAFGKDSSDMNRRSASHLDTKSESLCRRVGIDPLDLVFWMQNIRIWISQTIISRVVTEIEVMNKKLADCGLGDSLIGYVGVERLRKCASLPPFQAHQTEFTNLLSFLEVTMHQEYLVERLKELSQGGALSNFKWNSGGRFKGNEWSDKLPTDAELIMGCFAAYMDSRMPANFRNSTTSGHMASGVAPSGGQPRDSSSSISSHSIEDKPFTGVFYVTLPEVSTKERNRDNSSVMLSSLPSSRERHLSMVRRAHHQQSHLSSSSRSIVILQSHDRPPHFFLQVDGKEKIEISSGRNNLFHTLLFFLHHIKKKESGMLGRINLGVSGINILWVIDAAQTH